MRVATCPTGTMIFRFPPRCRVTVVSVRRSSGIARSAGELGTRSRPVSRHYGRSLPPPFRAITAWPNAYCRVVLPWCDDSTEVGDGSVPCLPGETGPTLSPYSARRPHDLRACPVHERLLVPHLPSAIFYFLPLARISQTHLGGVSSGADEPGCGSICVALRQSGPGLIV